MDRIRRVNSVASRPRIGGYSQARTLQLVWTSWRETQLGRDQLERFSWTGIGYNRTRQVLGREGFLMCICICSSPGRTDSNQAVLPPPFHVHLSAARNKFQREYLSNQAMFVLLRAANRYVHYPRQGRAKSCTIQPSLSANTAYRPDPAVHSDQLVTSRLKPVQPKSDPQ
jgi:hypothetical protein